MKEVYLIIELCPSGGRSIDTFSSRELAQLYLDAFKDYDEEYKIVKKKLNPFIREVQKGLKPYRVRISKEGDISECDHCSYMSLYNKKFFFDLSVNLVVDCMAKDEDHAIKLANERRSEALNNNIEWVFNNGK